MNGEEAMGLMMLIASIFLSGGIGCYFHSDALGCIVFGGLWTLYGIIFMVKS